MLDQILDKVNIMEFNHRSMVTNSSYKIPFLLKDVLYITTFKKGYVYFVYSKWNCIEKYKVKGSLSHFEKLFSLQAPHFKKCHKSYLVNTHKITSIDKGLSGNYNLSLEGLTNQKDNITLTAHFSSSFSELYGVKHLNYLEPFNKQAEKIRSFNLKSFGQEELKSLDLNDEKAKSLFRKRHGIHNFPIFRLLNEFHEKTNPDQIDKARVIKNVIYQVFQWLNCGVLNKFDGSMRRLWYKYLAPTIKKILPNKKDFTAEEASLYDYFNDFVELGIFTYKEFGFLDRYEFYRGIGETNPHIMVFMEKTTVFGFPRRLAKEFSTSFLVTSGQVPWLTAEYMSEDLKKVIKLLTTPLKFFTFCDLNPGGFSIANNLKKRFLFHGFKDIEIIQVIIPKLYSNDLIKKNRVPLISWKETKKGNKTIRTPLTLRDKRLFPNYYTWFFGDNKNWQGINDKRLIEVKKYKRYDKVTLYGMELDALELSKIETNFKKIITKHLNPKRPSIISNPLLPDLASLTISQINQIINNKSLNPTQKLNQIKALIQV